MKNKHYLFATLVFLSFVLVRCGGMESYNSKDYAPQEGTMTEEYAKAEAEQAYEEYDDDAKGYAQSSTVSNKETQKDDTNLLTSSSAAEVSTDSSKLFIRTADIKFKAKNVRTTTFSIENIIREFDGFVTYTNLQSTVDYTRQSQVSEDSALRSVYYTVQNDMVLRVPQKNLDTTLKRIAPLVDYLDYRVISADEITFTLIANKLAKKRLANYNARLSKAIDTKHGNLEDVTNSEEELLYKQEMADNVYIENLKVLDKVAYSTINLNIYQEQSIHYEMVKTEEEVDRYKPSFGDEFVESLKLGGVIVQYFVLFLAKIWVLLVLGVAGFIVYKRLTRKKD